MLLFIVNRPGFIPRLPVWSLLNESCLLFNQVCGIDKPYLNSSSIEQAHERIRQKCLDHFHMKKKMGGPQFCQAFEEKLMVMSVFLIMFVFIEC